MSARSIDLVWIAVSDFDQAVKFYTEVVGLKLVEKSDEWGWAELQGETGARLGIAKYCEQCALKPGENSVFSVTVENLDTARDEMMGKGAETVGDVCEVPGHVKMQLFKDKDGTRFHVTQVLHAKTGCGCH